MALTLAGASLTEDGVTAVVAWRGGRGTAAAYGTFGSGTATLEVSYDGGTTWFAVGSDTALTEDGHGNFELPSAVQLRWDLDGASTPDVEFQIIPHIGTK